MSLEPPRFFRALLERLLPRAEQTVVADLQEMFAKRVERQGTLRARMWYRAQAISFIARFAFERPSFSLLDWKLGFRMLFKYPGLSIVGGLALAVAIGFGAGFAHMGSQILFPDLGFEEGDRIVRLDRYDAASRGSRPLRAEELLAWREKLTRIDELSAYRTLERTLVATDADGTSSSSPVFVAQTTASTFPLTRVAPLRGRVLTETDEAAGAPDVIVLGYELWRTRFGADPQVLGREVQLGRDRFTVVGVMPEGFAFPEFHQAWVPLRLNDLRGSAGGTVRAFGRLADGVALSSAQEELTAVGAATIADLGGSSSAGALTASTGDSVRTLVQARVIGFADPDPAGDDLAGLLLASFIILMCLTAVCANVATLVFARTAMRESEIVVRNALGASRGRIIGQLFAEALVLSLVAAAVGLGGAALVIKYIMSMPLFHAQGAMPFWWSDTFEPKMVAVAVGLAVLSAALVALLPVLKATGKDVNEALKSMGAGAANLRFGGIWSAIIVFQVAITVLSLPFGIEYARDVWRTTQARESFPGERFLTFELVTDSTSEIGSAQETFPLQTASAYDELARRLRQEPGVEDITFGSGLPGMDYGYADFDVDLARQAGDSARTYRTWVRDASVDVRYVDVFELPIVAGRGLTAGDLDVPNPPVLINESFARALGGGAVGLRMRAPPDASVGSDNVGADDPGPWLEIVGVVRNTGANVSDRDPLRGTEPEDRIVYHPARASTVVPLRVAVRTKDAEALTPRVRAIAMQIDPGIRLYDVLPLNVAMRQRYWAELVAALSGVAGIFICILLSSTGLFALMAVAVARRTREVGIRLALGASRIRILAALFRRAALQLVLGTLVGSAIYLAMQAAFDHITGYAVGPILTVVSVMIIVGLIACAMPARRALRIKPVDALREG
jgi:putative ABC transport system permease protein